MKGIIMDQLKTAIVGIGNMGYAHAKAIFSGAVPEMRLVAVCDIDEGRLKAAASEFEGVKTYADYHRMLEEKAADVVIIATPHYFHPDIAIAAFRSGWHVLTEKPAGVYAGAVRVMISEAQRSGRVFGIMFNQRTNPLFARAREIVHAGMLGEPKRLTWIITNWYRTQHYYDSGDWRATWSGEGGGVLLNQAPHNLDVWQWIFGMPSSVRAICRAGRYHNIEVEDDVTIYAEYENGSTATFITSTGEFPGTNRLEIVGDRGKLVLEDGILKWWKLSVPEREFCFTSQKSFDKIPMEYEEIKPEKKESGHIGILSNFAGAVMKGEPLVAPGSEGLNELLISNAAYLSSWRGGEAVAIPPDDNDFLEHLKKLCEESKPKASNPVRAERGGYNDRWQVRW